MVLQIPPLPPISELQYLRISLHVIKSGDEGRRTRDETVNLLIMVTPQNVSICVQRHAQAWVHVYMCAHVTTAHNNRDE